MDAINFIYLLFISYLSVLIFFQIRESRFNSMLVINAFMLAYYAVPLYSFSLNDRQIDMLYGQPTLSGLLCVFLFYIFCIVGYNLPMKKHDVNYYIPNEQFFVRKTSIAVIAFSIFFFLVYCSLFGGFQEVMLNISSIRGGNMESSNKSLEFITLFYGMVIYAPVLLCCYWNSSSIDKRKVITKKLIVLSFFTAIIIKLSSGSRGAILSLILIFIIGSILNKKKGQRTYTKTRIGTGGNKKKYLLMVGVAFFTIVVLRPLFNFFQNMHSYDIAYASAMLNEQLLQSEEGRYSLSSPEAVFFSILRSFSHYSTSMELALVKVESGVHEKNYFMEFVGMIMSLLPSKLLGIEKLRSVTSYNSMYFGVEQNIPPGIIGSAIYSGGMLWVILYGFLVGFFGKRLDTFYARIKRNIKFSSFYYASLLFVFFYFAASGDFASQFRKAFTSFILFYYIYINLRVLRIKNANDK